MVLSAAVVFVVVALRVGTRPQRVVSAMRPASRTLDGVQEPSSAEHGHGQVPKRGPQPVARAVAQSNHGAFPRETDATCSDGHGPHNELDIVHGTGEEDAFGHESAEESHRKKSVHDVHTTHAIDAANVRELRHDTHQHKRKAFCPPTPKRQQRLCAGAQRELAEACGSVGPRRHGVGGVRAQLRAPRKGHPASQEHRHGLVGLARKRLP
mmetsp:Transcript_43481/g.120322  ORF Transcript_43481/g.120322 Transcript_43481/m.120322 type:complete len:210 (+) Transcript_43481:151-780(+)